MKREPKHVLITGASSGLGAALAEEYVYPDVVLYLLGRDEERLKNVKDLCERRGGTAHIKCLDVNDVAGMKAWIDELPDIDLVIANAGISAGTGGGSEGYEQVKKIFDTNIYGVLNTIYPAVEKMKKKQDGQIAIISSLAGFRGLSSSPAYCASKAAVRVLGEGMRGMLKKDGISLTVVTPGYITTPMTDVNTFYMPFKMDAAKAAILIATRLKKNPARIAFPWPFYAFVWLMSLMPACIVDPLVALFPGKPGGGAGVRY